MIALYLSHLRARGLSISTRARMGRLLEHWQAWQGDIAHATPADVRAYLLAPGPVGRTWALRTFYRWAYRRGLCDHEITIPKTKGHSSFVPRYLSPGQCARVCDNATGETRLLVELLYGAGLRIHEAAKLTMADIDLEAMTIRIVGKGGHERLALFGKPCAQVLYGKGGKLFDKTIRQLGILVRQAGRKAGIANLTPHELRRAFATHMLENGADADDVRRLLGHAKLETTMHYFVVTEATLQHAQNARS